MVADGHIIHGIDAASRAFSSIGNNQLIIIKFNGVAAPCALYNGNGGGLCRGEIDSCLAFHLQATIECSTFIYPASELRIEVPLVSSVGKKKSSGMDVPGLVPRSQVKVLPACTEAFVTRNKERMVKNFFMMV